MLDLLLTPKAEVDLEDIYVYTLQSWGVKQAESYQDELFNSFITILNNPLIGSIYYYKKGNYRKLKTNRHLVFYRTTNKKCIIVRILHERMDLEINLE